MPNVIEEWRESVEDAMDRALIQKKHGCCIEACQQMVTLSSQVTDAAGTSMTSNEKQERKADFEQKYEILKDICDRHLNDLSGPEREARMKELEGAKKTFDTMISYLD